MRKALGCAAVALVILGAACKKAPKGEPAAVDPAVPPGGVPPVVNPPELGAGEELPPPVDAGSDGDVAEAADADPPDAGPLLSCADGPYFPVQVGNSWTFEIRTKFGAVANLKLNKVAALEAVPVEGPHLGKTAFRFETYGGNSGGLKAVSWQTLEAAPEGVRLVRFAEMQYDPGKGVLEQISYWEPSRVRFDSGFAMFSIDQRWTEKYDDFKWAPGLREFADIKNHADNWIVQAVDEEVVVPAGRFKALRVKKLLNSTSDEKGKTYWFARCVGKVKELGAVLGGPANLNGQDEFLTAFTVLP
jgi:hypothetical protein